MSEPTTSEWRDLHESFREYCRAEPWQWFNDRDVVAVEHPSEAYTGYCVVMGSGGMEYGLAVYVGDDGLASYLSVMTGEVEPESLDAIERTRAVSAMLCDRGDLNDTDRATIRGLGLKYRGRGRWPLFRSTVPGYMPWYLDSEEAVFMTTALRNVMGVAAGVADGSLDLYSEDDPGLVLTRAFRDGAWRDRWETLRPPPPPADAPAYRDLERLRGIARSASRRAGTWELSRFYIHSAIQEEKGERPYLPTMVFAVDRDSSFILSTDLLGESPSPLEQQDSFVGILESAGWLPAEVVTDSNSTAQLLESITTALDIELFVGPTPVLDEAKAALMDFTAGLM